MAQPERRAPSTGSPSPKDTELSKEEEPEVKGTLFLTGILLMLIFGFWALMYLSMLDR